MQLYNSLGRKLEEFVPIEKNTVKLYTCGPTVYNYAHIGNLRTYIFEDLLRRSFEYQGYSVNHVMNITDVGHLTDDADDGEDKMVKSSRETGKSVWDIAKQYTEAFFRDTDRLNIKRPQTSCAATEHIGEMIGLIKRIEKNGYAYEAGGNIYFDTSKMPDYGELALLDHQEQQAGARIDIDSNKRNPRDFVLWFTNSKFENQTMQWDSPWGRGYPGWHIECSAMSMKYLGETFDIHCGGIDHLNVHHPNEIAQSEAATGKKWVNYWIHGEFLLMESGKMSKSKGGFITLENLIEDDYDPLDYRYFIIGAHYRSQLLFSKRSLDAAKSARMKLVNKIKELKTKSGKNTSLDEKTQTYIDQFKNDLSRDLNTPKALSRVWGVIKDNNLESAAQLAALLEMDKVLGLGFDKIEVEIDEKLLPEAQKLFDERLAARKQKDWQKSDELRDALLEMGIIVKDTPSGTEWTRKV